MQPLVFIALLNWNNSQDTFRCLESISSLEYNNFQVIIIDNGSDEDSIHLLDSDQRNFSLIINPVNYGYSGGNNIAIRYALEQGADYIWLLNNDAITACDTLDHLVAAMEADTLAGMCSPIIRYLDSDQIEYAGGYFEIETACHRVTSNIAEARQWQTDYPGKISLFGTGLLLRSTFLEAVGLLDEDLFAYWEDTDLSIRSNVSGFHNIIVFDTCIYHAKTPPEISEGDRKPHFYYYMTRNEMLLWRKHLSGSLQLKAIFWSVLRALGKIDHRRDDSQVAEACLAGIWDGLTGKTGEYKTSRRMPEPLRTIFYSVRNSLPAFFGVSVSRNIPI